MKITIIGSSGGGKSTLSRKISEKFDLPRFEIDRVWFLLGGHLVINGTPEEKQIVQEKIIEEVKKFLEVNDAWVCDGTYSKIQPLIADRADIVVLIQRPLVYRMASHLWRIITCDNRHSEVTPLQDLLFTKTLIKRWKKGEDVHLQEFTKVYSSKLVTLKSFSEIDRFFASLPNK